MMEIFRRTGIPRRQCVRSVSGPSPRTSGTQEWRAARIYKELSWSTAAPAPTVIHLPAEGPWDPRVARPPSGAHRTRPTRGGNRMKRKRAGCLSSATIADRPSGATRAVFPACHSASGVRCPPKDSAPSAGRERRGHFSAFLSETWPRPGLRAPRGRGRLLPVPMRLALSVELALNWLLNARQRFMPLPLPRSI
jgi:hypothetical protein